MASVTRRILLSSSRHPPRIRAHYTAQKCTSQWQRPLSTTGPRHDEESIDSTRTTPQSPTTEASSLKLKANANPSTTISNSSKKSKPKAPTVAERLASEQAAMLAKLSSDIDALNPETEREEIRLGKQGISWVSGPELTLDDEFEPSTNQYEKPGFWAEGEPEMGPDEDYYGDDLTSLGHGELEKHRELREYARLIAWELPLLNQLARPFEPPSSTTPFRFRYTSYLGEEHPATNKVVVEFTPTDLSLSPLQRAKLIKLAGPRYNPSTEIVKMSCELFDTLPQNKRFLGDSISKLLEAAKDPSDTFEDVPYDFRHHKTKPRYEFPKEWVLTAERKKYLEEKREREQRLDYEKLHNGELLDGEKIIATALPFTYPVAEPALTAAAGRSKKR